MRLVPEAKVTDYLLDPAHIAGGAKALFFSRFGFTRGHSALLIAALRHHPDENDLIATHHSAWGVKSVVRCRLRTPDGRDPCIQTVWVQESGSDVHRLVTAYPATPGVRTEG